jgi:LCP family protein required for cell wall assembly
VSAGPRPFLAALLSAVLPGAGQLYTGRRARGAAMVAVTTAILALAAAFWLQGPIFLLKLLVRPSVLLGLLAANAVLLGFRAAAVVDAYRLAARSRPEGARRASAAALALLVVVMAAPHVVAAYYNYRSYDLLESVFAGDEPQDSLITGTGESPLLEPPPATTEGAAAPRALQAHAKAKHPWLTMLLIGGDAGASRPGLRNDTMIVVALQQGTGKVAAFGVPRNLIDVPLAGSAGSRYGTYDEPLYALYGFGRAHADLFAGGRDPGATALKQTLSQLLGLRIDYYALVDLRGFVEMVDALGGVYVVPREHVQDKVSPPYSGEPWIPIDVRPGVRYHLVGREALAYARSRWASSDYTRMQRQRCLLSALAEQLDVTKILRAFSRFASAVKAYVTTDVPLSRLPDLVSLVADVDPGRSVTVTFGPPDFTASFDVPASWTPPKPAKPAKPAKKKKKKKQAGKQPELPPPPRYPVPDAAAIRETVRRMILLDPKDLRERYDILTVRQSC